MDVLRDLSRKELVRPARRSSMQGEAEYAFWHILTRDVAYSQLPRASRAARHVAAATWIESHAPDRVEDLADVLAYHYATALDLARAADNRSGRRSEDPARRFLTLAGERALGLDTARRSPTSSERSHSHPRATPTGPTCSSPSQRPPTTPRARSDAQTRSRRRSPLSSSAATSRPKPAP